MIDLLYNAICDCLDDISLPSSDTLKPCMKFVILITVTSIIGELLSVYTFISYKGALLALLILTLLIVNERRGYFEVFRRYSFNKLRTRNSKEKSKGTGTDV